MCPGGWHLPSQTEWNALIEFVGDSATAGKILKATNTWSDKERYEDGTDDYGLEKYPVGIGFLVLPSLGVKVEGAAESVHFCGRSLCNGCCTRV